MFRIPGELVADFTIELPSVTSPRNLLGKMKTIGMLVVTNIIREMITSLVRDMIERNSSIIGPRMST